VDKQPTSKSDSQRSKAAGGGSTSERLKRARIGNYEVLEQIGEGGMGRVFKARHVLLNKIVALKVLKPGLKQHGDALERFRKEAQALARVDHPNVVHVLDVGTTPKGAAFIAMDYVPGMDLKRWIKQRGALKPEALTFIARQLISGIAAAHRAGILHRDIKPDNVLVDAQATVKISDFGLAGDVRLAQRAMTEQKFATIAYAAPEVLHGKGANARSDVFSLGATLYHCAAGKLPFPPRSIPMVLAAQEAGAEPLRKLAPGVPRTLERAIMRALNADPAKRPEDASALLELAFPPASAGRVSGVAASLILSAGALMAIAGAITLSQPWSDPTPQLPSDAPSALQDQPGESIDSGERSRIESKQRELEALRAEQEANARKRSREAREKDARDEWQRMLEVLKLLRRESDAPERITLMSDFIQRFPSTAASADAATRMAGERSALEGKRVAAVEQVRSELQTHSPKAAQATLSSIADWLSLGSDDQTTGFRSELSTLESEIQSREKEIAANAINAAGESYERGEIIAALVTLREARAQCSSVPDALEREYVRIEKQRAIGEAQVLATAEIARREAIQQRALLAVAFTEKLRTLEADLRAGLSGVEREAAISRTRKSCPDALLPAWEKWEEEFSHLLLSEAWLQRALDAHLHRMVEVTPIHVTQKRAGDAWRAEVIGVDAEEVRLAGGTSGRNQFKLCRLHPRSWLWFSRNLPPNKATQEDPQWQSVMRICWLYELDRDMDWVTEEQGIKVERGEEPPLTRFANSAYHFLEAVQEAAQLAQDEHANLIKLAQSRPKLFAAWRPALAAIADAKNGGRGYAEASANLPAALISEELLYRDLMRGARVLDQFEAMLVRLPNDPEVIAACVELAREQGVEQLAGESIDFWIGKGLAVNPYSEALWRINRERDRVGANSNE